MSNVDHDEGEIRMWMRMIAYELHEQNLGSGVPHGWICLFLYLEEAIYHGVAFAHSLNPDQSPLAGICYSPLSRIDIFAPFHSHLDSLDGKHRDSTAL